MSEPELLERTVIVINDVTYRSPEDMPEDVRAIWDGFVRLAERQGIDWRNLIRIVLSHSREGNVVRHSISIVRHGAHIERWSGNSPQFDDIPQFSDNQRSGRVDEARHDQKLTRRARQRVLWVLLCVSLAFLGFYGLLWETPPLVRGSDSVWPWLAFVLLYGPWLWAAVDRARRRRRASAASVWESNPFRAIHKAGWRWYDKVLAVLLGILVLTYVAAFGGVAKLLHYTERVPGEVTVTIARKDTAVTRKGPQCTPRLAFEECRFIGEVLCVDSSLFSHVKVGDRIRIKGMVSRYAIEPDTLEVVREEPAVLQDLE